MTQRQAAALQWVNELLLNTSHQANRRVATTAKPFQSITDLSSFDFAQLIVALHPTSNARFTFVPGTSTAREIYEAHLKNYRSAVSEMGPLNVNAEYQAGTASSSSVPMSLPERLCQGDVVAHTALLNAIYAHRREFPTEYDWVRTRQRLEEKEMFPDNRPLGWTSNAAGETASVNDPRRNIEFNQEDRQTYQLLTQTTRHLDASLQKALSFAPYFSCSGTALETKEPVQTELFELMLLTLGETAEEAGQFMVK